MSVDTEVHYVIPDGEKRQDDFEILLASFGRYQDTLPRTDVHTVLLEDQKGAYFLRLQRSLNGLTDPQRVAELTKDAIESHIPEEDRVRISKYFAGYAIKGDTQHIYS